MGTWWFFARQALNPMAFVLLGAAAVSLGLDMRADAAFILIVVGVNVVIGGIQEYTAERSAAMLGLPLLDAMVKNHLGRGARRATAGSRP